MNKIIDKINKPSLPAVILIASIILGGFYYASEKNKQKSIEKQQFIKAREDRMARYESLFRQECRNEKEEDFKTLEKLSQLPGVVENGLRNKGYTNDDGSFIDEDIWIKSCVEKKIEILMK